MPCPAHAPMPQVSAMMEATNVELAEAAVQLQDAGTLLREKAAEAKAVQQRTHALNSRISALIAASEAVPHREALERLHE